MQNQTIERTTLTNLLNNEEYTRKVLPFIKPEYFDVKEERIIFDEIQKLKENYSWALSESISTNRKAKRREEFENKIKELRNEISNYQKERNKTSNEIAKQRINASTKLIKKLTPILEEYSKKNSIKIIVQKKHIVMGKKEDDITKDILDLVNQKVKSIKLD